MENIKEIKVNLNRKGLKKSLNKMTRVAFYINKKNSVMFRVGRFIQGRTFKDEDSINKMYYDFSRANLMNKAFLLFIKENLLTCKNSESYSEILEMLSIQEKINHGLMSVYNKNFTKLMDENCYSSSETSGELIKILTNNKYLQNSLK